MAFCNYGFLQVQKYEPNFEGHQAAESWIDPFDKKKYVEVIYYFMLKVIHQHRMFDSRTFLNHMQGDKIDSVQRYDPITVSHVFPVDRDRLRCEEVLYVSDFDPEPDFPLDHPHNKGVLHKNTPIELS